MSMSGIKKKRFIVMLTPKDRYRHSHTRFRGEVLSFVVQYETILEGEWFPVGRYDTEHGFAHRDTFDKRGNRYKTPMFTDSWQHPTPRSSSYLSFARFCFAKEDEVLGEACRRLERLKL